jgi:multiple sugar transport system ATP-binding protein
MSLPTIEVTPLVVEELGSDAHVFFEVEAPRVIVDAGQPDSDEATLLAEKRTLFSARIDPRVRAEVGRPLTLAVDTSRFHFFDPQTHETLLGKPERDDPTLPAALEPAHG